MKAAGGRGRQAFLAAARKAGRIAALPFIKYIELLEYILREEKPQDPKKPRSKGPQA